MSIKYAVTLVGARIHILAKRLLPSSVKNLIRCFFRKKSPNRSIESPFNEMFEKHNQYLSSLPLPGTGPGFSFLTSVYQHTNPDFFWETAKAILNQSYMDYEWVILRHGPIPMRLATMLSSLEKESRVRIYSLENNLGILGGVAFCLDKANKEFIIPMDSDDLIVPETLAVLARHISDNETTDFFYSDEAMLSDGVLHAYLRGDFDPVLNFSASYIYHLVAFKKNVALEIGVYNNKCVEYCHDWDTVMRFFINHKKIQHIPEVLYIWRQHANSTSNSGQKYTLAEQSQQETLRFALQAIGQEKNFVVEEFPLFRGVKEYRCRWKKDWPQKPFLFVMRADGVSESFTHIESFLRKSAIPHDRSRSINYSPKEGYGSLSGLEEALKSLPRDAWCWIVDSRLAPKGEWLREETCGWFTLVPDVDFLCGNIIDANGIVLEGGAMFAHNDLLGSPETGTHIHDPGSFSMQLRPHCVDVPNSFFFGARVASLLAVLRTVPKTSLFNSLGVYIGIQCRLRQKRIGWSPLLQAEMKIPFCPSIIENFPMGTLSLECKEAMRISTCFPGAFSKVGQCDFSVTNSRDNTKNSSPLGSLSGNIVHIKNVLKRRAPRLFEMLKSGKVFCIGAKHVFIPSETPHPLSSSLHPDLVLDNNFAIDMDVKEILLCSSKPKLLMILPRVNPNAFSGGPNTAFLLAAEVAKAGHGVQVLSMHDSACSSQTLREHLCQGLQLSPKVAEKFETSSYAEAIICKNDKILATRYDTALLARTLGRQTGGKRFAYLLQDFEPMFYPWNEEHAVVAASYEADFLPIVNEPLLADFFVNSKIGCFAEAGFEKKILAFSPAVDRTCFYPQERPAGKRTLLFYARPYAAPRNLSRLGFAALSVLVEQGIINVEEWEVLTMGDPLYMDVSLGKGMVSKNLAWMDFHEYAKRVRTATIGLSLMLSPHTSYLPLEFAACGIPVVTSCYANKTTKELNAISPCLMGSSLAPKAVAECIERAIHRAEENRAAKDAAMLALPATWEEAFAPVIPGLLAFMNE